jgi:hypothetical protein
MTVVVLLESGDSLSEATRIPEVVMVLYQDQIRASIQFEIRTTSAGPCPW